MAYFEDLTPYCYLYDQANQNNDALNIGWLSDLYPFPQGETSHEFQEKLFAYCLDEFVVKIARGFHVCELCNISDDAWFEKRVSENPDNAHWAAIGDGEIRVIGATAIYAAPTLIYHYVVDHQYRPPDEFIDAVLNSPPPGSEAHKRLLKMIDDD
jgi:hypothetical protein